MSTSNNIKESNNFLARGSVCLQLSYVDEFFYVDFPQLIARDGVQISQVN
jgi:hypothetical protein